PEGVRREGGGTTNEGASGGHWMTCTWLHDMRARWHIRHAALGKHEDAADQASSTAPPAPRNCCGQAPDSEESSSVAARALGGGDGTPTGGGLRVTLPPLNVAPPEGAAVPDVALFVPCYVDQFYPQVGVATGTLLERLGCTVHFRELALVIGAPRARSAKVFLVG